MTSWLGVKHLPDWLADGQTLPLQSVLQGDFNPRLLIQLGDGDFDLDLDLDFDLDLWRCLPEAPTTSRLRNRRFCLLGDW